MSRLFLACTLCSSLLFFGCATEIQKQTEDIQANIGTTARQIEDEANKTVESINRKVEQGKEVIESVNDTLDKLNQFQKEEGEEE